MLPALALSGAVPLHAQQLPLRRDVPDPVPFECEAAHRTTGTTMAQDPQEAARLVGSAREASLLGDLRAARTLLAHAATLDTTAENIAFLHARTLEDLGEREQAAREYCRYAALTTNQAEAAQIQDRVRLLAPPTRPGIPDSAVTRFAAALASADAGRMQEADASFAAVIAAAPSWAVPYYNRALVRARLNRRSDARADLERVLQLEPAGGDAQRVRSWIAQLSVPNRELSSGTAFALGLLPGGGHFYSGRTTMGTALLAVSAGAVALGVLHETRRVDCLGVPEDGVCPPEQVLREVSDRPYLLPALGVAAAASIIGAIDAARGVRRRNARGVVLSFEAGGIETTLLVADVGSSGVDLTLIGLRF